MNKMQWARTVRKKNGAAREQFSQWMIPAAIRDQLAIGDGDSCVVSVSFGQYSSEPRSYLLRSGGEIYLPVEIAGELRERAEKEPNGMIFFSVSRRNAGVRRFKLERVRLQELKSGAFYASNEADARKRILTLIVRRQGQPEFRGAYSRLTAAAALFPHAIARMRLRPHTCNPTVALKPTASRTGYSFVAIYTPCLILERYA